MERRCWAGRGQQSVQQVAEAERGVEYTVGSCLRFERGQQARLINLGTVNTETVLCVCLGEVTKRTSAERKEETV